MQPFTLFDFTSGIDQSREDWLIPDKSFTQFDEGYVDLGFVKGREGYDQFCDGGKGSAPECESRMVVRITGEITGVNSSTTNTNNIQLKPLGEANGGPIRRGTLQLVTSSETLTDDGVGGWTSSLGGSPTGTIDYETGLLTNTVFTSSNGEAITATYDHHPGLSVMMIANYVSDSNARQLIVADTKFVNRLNNSTNRLDDISQTYTITGGTQGATTTVTIGAGHKLVSGMQVTFYGESTATSLNGQTATVTVTSTTQFTVPINTGGDAGNPADGIVKVVFSGTDKDFFHWVNYPDPDDSNILVLTNNVDPVHYYNASIVQPFETYTNAVTARNYEEPDGADAYDPSAGPPATFTNLKALRVHYQRDRLVLLNVSWQVSGSDTRYPKRILISGFGANAMRFKSSNPGAGQIDLSDQRWIQSSEDANDDVLIETELNPWLLKYTGNDVVPFTLERIGVTSGFTGGSNAPMSTITHRNITYTVNRSGIVGTDGQNVQRADEQIPNYIINEVKPDDIEYVYSGIQKDDKFIMMLYPSQNSDSGSDEILVLNYEHFSFSRFKTAFSSIGNYRESFDITWNDLSIYSSWQEFANDYNTWNDIAYTKSSIVTILGGHNGQIWRGFQENSLDNPVNIRALTKSGDDITVTTDYNNFKAGDVIYITGTAGSTEINNQSITIQSITDNYTFVATGFKGSISTYTSGGTAARQIPFRLTTKKFNPFVEKGRQVRVGWCEIYCDVVGSPGDAEHLSIRFFKGDYDEPVDSGYPSELPFEVIISNRTPDSEEAQSTQTRIWKKFRINQTGNFFRLSIANDSPLKRFKIHSVRLGMAPGGPLRDQ